MTTVYSFGTNVNVTWGTNMAVMLPPGHHVLPPGPLVLRSGPPGSETWILDVAEDAQREATVWASDGAADMAVSRTPESMFFLGLATMLPVFAIIWARRILQQGIQGGDL